MGYIIKLMFVIFFAFSLCFDPKDPYFGYQFSLKNDGQNYGIEGEDIDIDPVWSNGHFGQGVHVSIISNGCYYQHNDLNSHFDMNNSWNYLTWNNDPSPQSIESKGTELAGIVGASTNNVCTIGVAPESIISCMNLDNTNFSKMNLIDSLKRGNPIIRVKLFASNHYEDDVTEELESSPSSTVFITTSGEKKGNNDDCNSSPFARNPRMLVVSETNHKGAHSSWSQSGTNILISATVGGSSSFSNVTFPSQPGLGIFDVDSCNNQINPKGTGAAYVAGAISSLLSERPDLNWRDIHVLVAISSMKNDPKHFSWLRNGAGYLYSDYYGFGTINSDYLLYFAQKWKSMPEQFSQTKVYSNMFFVPVLRSGSYDFNFSIDSNIVFVEYVMLSFGIEENDVSLLRVYITSPSGTKINVKKMTFNHTTTHLEYTIRGFFGENGNGNWTVHLVSDSLFRIIKIINSSFILYGTKTKPQFNKPQDLYGHNSYEKPSKSSLVEIEIEESKKNCGNPFFVNISSKENTIVDLFLGDIQRNSKWPLGVSVPLETKKIASINVPCHFLHSSHLFLIAENSETGVWGEAGFEIENAKKDLVLLKPNRYQVIRKENNHISIDVSSALSLPYIPDGLEFQKGFVSIYDMDKNNIIYSSVEILNGAILLEFNMTLSCPKCILSVVPFWYYPSNDCISMIQPISILDPLEPQPQNWPIPLNDYCPLPPGILTPTPSPDPSQTNYPSSTEIPSASNIPKYNNRALISSVIFVVTFVIGVGIFFTVNREQIDLNSYMLVSENQYT